MNPEQNKQKKKILRDPVAEYARCSFDNNQNQTSRLNTLWQQYCNLKTQYSAIQDQSRQISRQIGEAKREGIPVDDLKALMQEQSAKRGAASENLEIVERQILSFFESELEPKETKQVSLPKHPERIYSSSLEDNSQVSISLLDAEQAEWNTYVEGNPAASIYHRCEWRELIHKSFGHESFYFFAQDKNRNMIGILPLIHLKSRLFGDFLVSMPYFNYGGAVADNPLIEKKLIEKANQHAAKLGVSHIEYRDDIPRSGLPTRTEKVNMMLSLPETRDELWKSFSPKLRAQIKRPQQENTKTNSGNKELLDDFYTVFSRNMRDLGTPVYGKDFFRNILYYFPEQCTIITVQLNNQPVAAAFVIGNGDTLEIPWASAIREVNHLSMNMLLYWEVLCFALKNNYRNFDFGRSSKNSGTFRFKKQWGAIAKPSYWHYWLSDGQDMPSLNPANPKFALAINIWKRLPLTVTKWLGPIIVKNLP